MGDGEGVVVVSSGHVGCPCCWGNVSSSADVLGMSVGRGMRRVGRVFEMHMCFRAV